MNLAILKLNFGAGNKIKIQEEEECAKNKKN